ncbi:MAG: hypothetical protein ACHQWU_04570 [Gemmatimonadales bacterium]
MRRVSMVLVVAGVLAAQACGDMTSPQGRSVAGVYTLTTVNGVVPPLTLGATDSASVDLISGTVTFRDDGTFLDVINVRLTGSAAGSVATDSAVTARGNYTRAGSTLTLDPTDGHSEYHMTVTDDLTLTESNVDFLIVYHRS